MGLSALTSEHLLYPHLPEVPPIFQHFGVEGGQPQLFSISHTKLFSAKMTLKAIRLRTGKRRRLNQINSGTFELEVTFFFQIIRSSCFPFTNCLWCGFRPHFQENNTTGGKQFAFCTVRW